MGQFFWFKCDGCGYEAELSGGPDAGMLVAVQTMACSHCRQLADVVTSVTRYADQQSKSIPVGQCPTCHRSDGLTKWGRDENRGGFFSLMSDGLEAASEIWGECPRCQDAMRNLGSRGLWD